MKCLIKRLATHFLRASRASHSPRLVSHARHECVTTRRVNGRGFYVHRIIRALQLVQILTGSATRALIFIIIQYKLSRLICARGKRIIILSCLWGNSLFIFHSRIIIVAMSKRNFYHKGRKRISGKCFTVEFIIF